MPFSKRRRQGFPTFPTSEKRVVKLPSFTFTKCSVASDRHVERNEDSVIIDQQRGLAAVFDGVGGSVAGEVASQVAAQTIRRSWKKMFLQLQEGQDTPMLLADCERINLYTTLLSLVEEAHEQILTTGARRAAVQSIK